MLALTIIFANSLFVGVNAGFNLEPIINEAVIGESTYFDCTTMTHTNEVNWHYYRIGAKDHEDVCLYCLGKVHPLYENKIKVGRIRGSDTYRLNIRSVQREDAGRYVCEDNGGIGESLSAQLVVLVSAPVCHTNMKPDGLLMPNSCNIEPDELQMSCSVSYYGNSQPLIQWREVQSAVPINSGVSCKQTDNQMICNISINASLDLHGSSYVCEIATSAATRYNCSSGVINVMQIDIDNSVTETSFDTKTTVNCLEKSSQPCSCTWTWVDGIHDEVVSTDAALTPSKIGWYKCEVERYIRGRQCTMLAKLVHISEQTSEPRKMLAIITATLGTQFFFLIFLWILIIRRRHGTSASTPDINAADHLMQGIETTTEITLQTENFRQCDPQDLHGG